MKFQFDGKPVGTDAPVIIGNEIATEEDLKRLGELAQGMRSCLTGFGTPYPSRTRPGERMISMVLHNAKIKMEDNGVTKEMTTIEFCDYTFNEHRRFAGNHFVHIQIKDPATQQMTTARLFKVEEDKISGDKRYALAGAIDGVQQLSIGSAVSQPLNSVAPMMTTENIGVQAPKPEKVL